MKSVMQGWHSCSSNLTSLAKTGGGNKGEREKIDTGAADDVESNEWEVTGEAEEGGGRKSSSSEMHLCPQPNQATPQSGLDICANKVIRSLIGHSLQGVIQQNDLTYVKLLWKWL